MFDDADLERALDAVIFMIFSINGERCTSSSRLLIQQSIRTEFEAKLVERIKKIKVGHPLDPDTEIGPLISEAHFNKVTSYFDIAGRMALILLLAAPQATSQAISYCQLCLPMPITR